MKRLLLTIACWLTFCVAPGETQQSTIGFDDEMPEPVGMVDTGQQPGWFIGTNGPCGEVGR